MSVINSLRNADRRIIGQLRRVLARAVALGTDARDAATAVKRYLSPWYAPRRAATGRVLGGDRSAGGWPGTPGAASAHDRLLMETEASRAHGEAVVRRAARSREPMGVRWMLAPAHWGIDPCDDRARRDTGFGQGVYAVAEVPPYPSHPRCRCVLQAAPLTTRDGREAA